MFAFGLTFFVVNSHIMKKLTSGHAGCTSHLFTHLRKTITNRSFFPPTESLFLTTDTINVPFSLKNMNTGASSSSSIIFLRRENIFRAASSSSESLIAVSVTRLGYFLKYLVAHLLSKLAQLSGDFLGCFENINT